MDQEMALENRVGGHDADPECQPAKAAASSSQERDWQLEICGGLCDIEEALNVIEDENEKIRAQLVARLCRSRST